MCAGVTGGGKDSCQVTHCDDTITPSLLRLDALKNQLFRATAEGLSSSLTIAANTLESRRSGSYHMVPRVRRQLDQSIRVWMPLLDGSVLWLARGTILLLVVRVTVDQKTPGESWNVQPRSMSTQWMISTTWLMESSR
jgi:hypothetical protein